MPQTVRSFEDIFSVADEKTASRIKQRAGLGTAEVAAAATTAALVKPGKERWKVKTLQDPKKDRVGKGPGVKPGKWLVVDTSIEEMRSFPRPKSMADVTNPYMNKPRISPVETTIWRLTADIVAVKNEADGDLHLVLQEGNNKELTMVAESPRPDTNFIGPNNPWQSELKAVRTAIEKRLHENVGKTRLMGTTASVFLPEPEFVAAAAAGPAPSGRVVTLSAALNQGLAFQAWVKPMRVELTGVGFFDRVHGQLGVAETNGIELHPLLAIKWL